MIRKAKREDVPSIIGLIQELAEYENAPNEVVNTVEELEHDLFDDKICSAFVAVVEEQIVGFALYYLSYSTWKGKCIYLEDLYVQPEYRKLKIGSQLFDQVVQVAKTLRVRRMDWQVLDWNEPAITFYQRKQAHLDPEWINGRLFFD